MGFDNEKLRASAFSIFRSFDDVFGTSTRFFSRPHLRRTCAGVRLTASVSSNTGVVLQSLVTIGFFFSSLFDGGYSDLQNFFQHLVHPMMNTLVRQSLLLRNTLPLLFEEKVDGTQSDSQLEAKSSQSFLTF